MDTLISPQDIIALSSEIGATKMVECAFPNYEDRIKMGKPLGVVLLTGYFGMMQTDLVHLTYLYRCLAMGTLECYTEQSMQIVRQGLHDCVWSPIGTASKDALGALRAQSDVVSIAGKTGSCCIWEGEKRNRNHHDIFFVGYFPEENPRYTCLVMFHHPHAYGMYSAADDCGRTVRRIAERIITEK